MAAKDGDTVKIEYTGSFEDGTVFDSSEKHGQPLTFKIGGKQVIKGFENSIIGMEIGEEKEVTLQPEEAYGQHNPELIKKVPRDKLPKDHELKPGMMLAMALPNGVQMPATITEVGEEEVTIDINPPLAGKVLNFKMKLIEIIDEPEKKEGCESKEGCNSENGCGYNHEH